jgi:hypothetical protein
MEIHPVGSDMTSLPSAGKAPIGFVRKEDKVDCAEVDPLDHDDLPVPIETENLCARGSSGPTRVLNTIPRPM